MPVHSLRTHTLAPRSTPVLRSLRFRSEISHIRVNLCSSVVSEVGKIANPQSETGNEKSVAPQRFSQAGRRLIAVACKLWSRLRERRPGGRHRAGRRANHQRATSPSLPAATARRVPKRSLPKSRVARAGSGTRFLRAVAVGSLVRRVPARGVGGASPRASHPCGARAAGAVVRRSSVSACVGAGVVLSVRASGVCGPASSVGVCPVES